MATNPTVMDPSIVEMSGKAIAPPTSQLSMDETGMFLDESWAKSAFLISDSQLEGASDIANRYWSSATQAVRWQ